jgi:hypothetical protein
MQLYEQHQGPHCIPVFPGCQHSSRIYGYACPKLRTLICATHYPAHVQNLAFTAVATWKEDIKLASHVQM